MLKKRFLLLAIVLFISLTMALPAVAAYGAWQHQRYWEGTIARVQARQIAVLESIFDTIPMDRLSDVSPNEWFDMLSPIHDVFAVKISSDGTVIHDSSIASRPEGDEVFNLRLPHDVIVTVSSYRPPSWLFNLKQWLRRPAKWFTPRFDYITMPFLFFALIFFLGQVIFIWYHRARHLEGHVIPMLDELRSNGDADEG